MAMVTKRLGNSDLAITPLGIGAWAMGGANWAFSWGEQDDQESIAAIRKAVDAGINWIDTAAVYGLGKSEKVVAEAVSALSQKPFVFTKCERVWDEKGEVGRCLKADSIRRECEDSLRRLQVDVIDLYQIHWPQPEEDIEEGWTAMAELKAQGKVRHIGVSNFNVEQMKRAHKIAPITSLQPPYNALRREIEAEILPFCAEHNIGVIVYSPMASGLLTGKVTRERVANFGEGDWRSRSPAFQEPALTTNLEVADKMGEVGARHGRSAAEAAIAWTLSHPAVTGAIVGVRTPDQVDGIIGGMEFRLTDEEMGEIQEVGKSVSR